MKTQGHGQAKILTPTEINQLFKTGLQTDRDRALFGVCLYTGCRIAEACSLNTVDVFDGSGLVLETLTIRKGNTKGDICTRQIDINPVLRSYLESYGTPPDKIYLFPGRHGRGHINPRSADEILRVACNRVGIIGASTHSFRRTALTQMNNSGISLRVIQEISGHQSLEELKKYLEVKPEQVKQAISTLDFSEPV